jgi:hypothetical protein
MAVVVEVGEVPHCNDLERSFCPSICQSRRAAPSALGERIQLGNARAASGFRQPAVKQPSDRVLAAVGRGKIDSHGPSFPTVGETVRAGATGATE